MHLNAGVCMKNKTISISPFANESDSLAIGGLTIENRVDRISLYGSIDITRDQVGRAHAERLKALFDDIVRSLRAEHLPPAISQEPTDEISNPFAGDE